MVKFGGRRDGVGDGQFPNSHLSVVRRIGIRSWYGGRRVCQDAGAWSGSGDALVSRIEGSLQGRGTLLSFAKV